VHIDLLRARLDAGEGICDRKAEIVVAMHRERHLAEIAAAAAHVDDECCVLRRERVADGVGEIDDRRARADGDPADACDERGIGASRILARELDLVDERGGVLDRPARLLDDLVGLEAELLLHVDRARPEHDVNARPNGAGERLGCGIDVLATGADERRDGGCLKSGSDGAHALEVARRRTREPGLDDVHAQPLELLGDLGFLVREQRDAGGLLPVAQRRIEDLDPAGHEHFLQSPGARRRTCGGNVGVCGYEGRVFVCSP